MSYSFMSFSAEASSRLPDEAYHARAARERTHGDYAFSARAFPNLFSIDDTNGTDPDNEKKKKIEEMKLDALTQLRLNDRDAPSAESRASSSSSSSSYHPPTSSSSSSSSSSYQPSSHPPASNGGLDLTLHESHTGNLIGSIVWDGGKVLSWLLESMHSRVRTFKDGKFVDTMNGSHENTTSAAPSFTSPSLHEYLSAQSAGYSFDIPRDFLVGARVLELGAGTGITSLACIKLGAREVCITDIGQLIPLMKENVRRNCPGVLREWGEKEHEKGKNGDGTEKDLIEEKVDDFIVNPTIASNTSSASSHYFLPITTATSSRAVSSFTAARPDAPISIASSHSSSTSSVSSSSSSSSRTTPSVSSSSLSASSSSSIPLPLSLLYHTCTNCDDLCEEVYSCSSCNESSLCQVCDSAFHKPEKKKAHARRRIRLGEDDETLPELEDVAMAGSSSTSAAASSHSLSLQQQSSLLANALLTSSPLPPLPPTCGVYVEELLWGEHATRDTLAPSLRQQFDVIILADVVYDAWSTSGVGSESCDNYRRLFHSLCLLTNNDTIVLLTYTPRRSPERIFFELLSTEFVWTTHRACDLLPQHDQIDDRIWIYQLHRTCMAKKLNAMRDKIYQHSDELGSELAIIREQEQDRLRQRGQEKAQKENYKQQQEEEKQFMSVSASSISSSSLSSSLSATSACSSNRSVTQITPTFSRYLECEEERQQRMLKEKIRLKEMRKVKKQSDAVL